MGDQEPTEDSEEVDEHAVPEPRGAAVARAHAEHEAASQSGDDTEGDSE